MQFGVLAGCFAASVILSPAAHSVPIVDETTFQAFTVTYDPGSLGMLQFGYEADPFTGLPPADQFGFGRMFFSPAVRAETSSVEPSSAASLTGEIRLDAKPGWGLYNANFTQSGQWRTSGSGTVGVDRSAIDIDLGSSSPFYNDNRSFLGNLSSDSGFYYLIREVSTFDRLSSVVIRYSINLAAIAPTSTDSALIFADIADPTTLGTPGPYFGSNIVGTFLSASFERVEVVSEPGQLSLVLLGLGLALAARRRYF